MKANKSKQVRTDGDWPFALAGDQPEKPSFVIKLDLLFVQEMTVD